MGEFFILSLEIQMGTYILIICHVTVVFKYILVVKNNFLLNTINLSIV